MELLFPPGVVRTKSPSAAMERWIDAQWIRFVPDPEKIGGCTRLYETVLEGIPRTAFTWNGTSGIEWRAYASERRLYASDFESEPQDITPLRLEGVALADNPFAFTNGSAEVIVTHLANGADQNDTVIFHGAASGGFGSGLFGSGTFGTPRTGAPLIDGPYRITRIIDANHYAIEIDPASTVTDANNGGAFVTADYEINVGPASSIRATGFGAGLFGRGTFGTPRELSTLIIEGRHWSLDNYGSDLLAAYQGSRVYLYDDSVDDRARVLENSPTDVIFAFVTEERFIMELCADMWLRWPDRDDPTDAVPSEINTANARRLSAGNRLICGCVLGGGISLIWSDSSVYLAQYIGGDFIYDTRVVVSGVGIAGPGAFTIADGQAFWTDGIALHMFINSLVSIPNVVEVAEWFSDNITSAHKAKCFTFFNAAHREVWFCFPAFGNSECSHYCAVNLDQWYWTSGEMPASLKRSCATDNSDRSRLIMVSPDGIIYQHEIGVDAAGVAIPWNLKSGLFNSPDGVKTLDVMGFVLDAQVHVGDITLEVRAQDFPETAPRIETKILAAGGGRVYPRLSGSYFGIELSQEVVGGDYHGGKNILLEQPGGAR